MPALLSEGNRRYNQMKRVHPKDPVSKLGYYLPSAPISPPPSSSSLNSSPLTSGSSSNTAGGCNYNGRSSTGRSDEEADSYYRTSLSRALRARRREASIMVDPEAFWFNADRSTQARHRQVANGNQSSGKKFTGSPLETSGFSEGTIAEGTCRESFGKPARHLVELGNPNWNWNNEINHGDRNIVDKTFRGNLKYAKGKADGEMDVGRQRRASSGASISKQNILHLKRNNRNNRLNRRLLLDGDHLINPYALSELFSQSEIPGFREIFASDSYLRKFCWIVAFLFMTVLSLNDMTQLITEYYEFPITVDVRLRDSARLPFPAVTVCNLNVVRFSALCSSSTSASNSRFDLTSQIRSELRDKLCGIQVDKSNTTDDSDMSDINNIGITSSTTTTTTTSTTTTTTTTTTATSAPTTGMPPVPGSTPASKPPIMDDGHRLDESGNLNQEHSGRPSETSPRPPMEHKTTRAPETSQTTSTRRPPTMVANGGLDLSDFSDRTLFAGAGGRSGLRLADSNQHRKRSIRFTDTEFQGDSQPRPFASSKWKVRIRPTSELPPAPEARRPVRRRHNLASQLGKLTSNAVSPPNRANNNNPGGQPASGQIRLGAAPGQTPVDNVRQNPQVNNLGAPPHQQSTTTPQPATTTPMSFVPPTLPDDFELTERQERELQENLTNWLAVMYQRDPQLTMSLGHQFDDMILRCTMKSVNCTHQRSFENSFTPTEGNCFTYRSRVKRRPVKGSRGNTKFDEANLAGTNHGLELVLNLEKNEYVSGSSQVGALVMIHHPNDLGYAASEATFVAPEFTTYIGLKMVNITRLPAPYPEYCIDSWPAKFADTLTRNSTYSQQACLKICLQKTVQSHCQCQSAILPIVELEPGSASSTSGSTSGSSSSAPNNPTGSAPTAGNATIVDGGGNGGQSNKPPQQQSEPQQRIIICDTRKYATRQCVREVMFRAADRVHNCECPPKCQVVRYDKTISMARWPTREDKVTFDRGKMDVNFQNLAKVIVYFQTMTCEEVTQQAVFNEAKLFSALGGIMGMYVGFSFLSVFEIFEVMSRKMWHHFTTKLAHTTSGILANFRS